MTLSNITDELVASKIQIIKTTLGIDTSYNRIKNKKIFLEFNN